MIGDWWALAAQVCQLSFVIFTAVLSFISFDRSSSAIGYGYSLEPGAVIHVDGDEEEDSFDHVEREIGAGEA